MIDVEWEPDQPPSRSKGFATTHLLLCVIAVIGLAILYNVTRLPDNDPFKECERIIGMDQACQARIAGHALKWGFYPR